MRAVPRLLRFPGVPVLLVFGYVLGLQVMSLRLIMFPVSSLYFSLHDDRYVLFFQKADALFEDHLLGVPVPVMVTAALRAGPFPDAELFHVRVPVPAADAGLAAREPPGYLEEPPAGPFQLVFHLLEEPVPSRRGNGFGQPAVLHHAFYIQVFADEHPAAVRNAPGQLVLEVLPLVRSPALFPCHLRLCLLPVL